MNTEIYDRLLHKRDICYDIKDLHSVVESGGYNIVEYDSSESRIHLSLNPNVFIKNMVPAISKKSVLTKQCIGAMFNGMLIKHSIYMSKETESKVQFYGGGNVIFANGSPLGFQSIIHENTKQTKIGNISYIFANLSRKGGQFIGEFVFPSSEFSQFAILRLTQKPMTPAFPEVIVFEFVKRSNSTFSTKVLKKDLRDLYWYLELTGIFLLKKKTIRTFPKSRDTNVRFVVSNVS